MSYAIRRRIHEIRTQKKINQEDIASVLGISRQWFARIENGQSEISYAMIQKTADYFAVPVSSITSANEDIDLKLYFRDIENADNINSSVSKIAEILRTFHAHEKLYNRMKGETDEIWQRHRFLRRQAA